jgi:hypothetical protein
MDATKSWELSTKECAALLDVPTATWSRIKNGSYRGRLGQDKVTRINLIVSINKEVDRLRLPPNWLSFYSELDKYNWHSSVSNILEGGIIAMVKLLKALQAMDGI